LFLLTRQFCGCCKPRPPATLIPSTNLGSLNILRNHTAARGSSSEATKLFLSTSAGMADCNAIWNLATCQRSGRSMGVMACKLLGISIEKKTKLRGLSPRENYTARATATFGLLSGNFCG
jgi:hypothetical protein